MNGLRSSGIADGSQWLERGRAVSLGDEQTAERTGSAHRFWGKGLPLDLRGLRGSNQNATNWAGVCGRCSASCVERPKLRGTGKQDLTSRR